MEVAVLKSETEKVREKFPWGRFKKKNKWAV